MHHGRVPDRRLRCKPGILAPPLSTGPWCPLKTATRIWQGVSVWPLILFLGLAACAFQTWAAEPPITSYETGSQAFAAGDYEAALKAFLEARAQGLDSPKLDYNLGVTYYKLSRYEEARKAFLASARGADMAPLAHYNLGLVALKEEKHEEARTWFARTLEESDNPKLQSLASAMIEQMDQTVQHAPPSRWSGFISGSAGFDSNVTLVSDSETIVSSDKNDQFLDFFAYGKARFAADGTRSNNLEASLYILKYLELSDFDTSSARLGGSMERKWHGWQMNSGLHYVNTRLDNEGYTQSGIFSLRGRRKLHDNHLLGFRYEYSYIDDLDRRFAFLQGWRQKTEAESTWLHTNNRLKLSYQLELNNRRDIDTSRYISFSPTRHRFRLRSEFQLDPQAEGSIDLRYRYSRYNDPTELTDGTHQIRRESRYQVVLSLTQNLKRGRSFTTEYRYIHNTSNFRIYDYNQHLLTVNMAWPW